METATTKLSSKGQVVLPEAIRNKLGLQPGEQFVVMGEGDVVVLKRITPPSVEDLEPLLRSARREAKNAGLKQSDVKRAIKQARKR